MLAALAAATARQEACCLIDVTDAFDPLSAAAAGIDLARLLWVRCGDRNIGAGDRRPTADGSLRRQNFRRIEQALKVADIILQGGGFGLVAIDMADIAPAEARRVPLTSWFRFRRAVERTPTVLLALSSEPVAGTCASAVVQLSATPEDECRAELPSHARLLEKIEICAEVLRTPGRKQPAAAIARFAARRAG
jgi:recombination protein RecA